MKKMNRLFCILAGVCMIVSILAMSLGESSGKPAAEAPEEAGLAEIQGILDVQPVGDMEGMDLEALTTALAENAFGEYYDPVSGFRMLYPSILLFDEEEKGLVALSDDGNIRMTIESTPDGGQLSVPESRPDGESGRLNPGVYGSSMLCDGKHRGWGIQDRLLLPLRGMAASCDPDMSRKGKGNHYPLCRIYDSFHDKR